MAQAFSRRPLTAETRFGSHDSPCEIGVDKVTLGKAFVPVLRFSPVGIILPLPRNYRAYRRRYLNLSQQLHRCSAHLTHSYNQTFLVSRNCEVFTQQSTAAVSCCSVERSPPRSHDLHCRLSHVFVKQFTVLDFISYPTPNRQSAQLQRMQPLQQTAPRPFPRTRFSPVRCSFNTLIRKTADRIQVTLESKMVTMCTTCLTYCVLPRRCMYVFRILNTISGPI